MKAKHVFVTIALVLIAFAAKSADQSVLIVNATVMILDFEIGPNQEKSIHPGESGVVPFSGQQWIRFGLINQRYDGMALRNLATPDRSRIILQVQPDSLIYLMPDGTTKPEREIPPQPKGFPLRPEKIVDTT